MSKAIGYLGALALFTFSTGAYAQAANANPEAKPDAKPSRRVTVVEVAPPAHKLAAALSDVLAERKDVGILVDVDKARSWFALCVDDETDRCFTNVCKNHQIDLVLRAWASSSGGKLSVSIDFVKPHEHGLQTFEETNVDASNPEAIHACAQRAVEKVLGQPPSPTPTTPPIVLAPPTEVKPAALSTPSTAAVTTPTLTENTGGTSGLRVASYVTGGVGAAALVVGVVEAFNVSGQNKTIDDNKNQALAGDANARAAVGDAYGKAKSAATIANVGLAVGGAAVVAGVVMFFLSPNETPKATASIGVVNGGPALAVSGKF